MTGMQDIMTRRQLLKGALALALGLMIFFAGRAAYRFIRYRNGADELVEPWMSIGYVARAHKINPKELNDLLGLKPDMRGKPDRRPLGEIADSLDVKPREFLKSVNDAVAKLQGTPAPVPPAP